ncbi:hypothetical protein D3C81_2323870 [compost metagenome]
MSGFAFDIAINAFKSVAGESLVTLSTPGTVTNCVIGVKSCTASYVSVLYTAGFVPCVLDEASSRM